MAGIVLPAVISGATSSVVEMLVSKVLDALGKSEDTEERQDLQEELEFLELKVKSVRRRLEDAESKQSKDDAVRAWLGKLNDIAYDAEDLLDGYVTDVATLHITEHNQLGLTKEIKRINNRYESVLKEMKRLGLQHREMPDRGNSSSVRGRQSTSLLDVDWPIIGRDDEKNGIIELLRSNEVESNKLPVLPIVGMGGVGKTSLAQLVFHDESLKAHFPLRIWVFVSQDFDPCKILRSIIESIYAHNGEEKTCYSTSLEGLQNETRKLIEKEKFLLILDDVWNEEQCLWKQLLTPLKLGKNGSKVMVTTRSQTVAKSIYGHMNPVILESMDDNYIWKILERGAFKGVADLVDDENLRNIGRKIVEKLKGSPLAAKTIGRLLGTNLNKKHWEMILKSDLWEVRGQKEEDIMPSLWLSYQYLPPILKNCFSLCSLFPKGHRIPKEKLSCIWIAHSIFPLEHGMTPENSAAEALQDLISMSLLSQDKDDDKFVTMHDLIHDVSKFVSREDHLQINDNIVPEKHPPKLRHLSVSNMNWVSFLKTNWESKLSCDKLRSVLCTVDYFIKEGVGFNFGETALNGLLDQSKWLRVLDLRGYPVQVLPNSIGKLKHLRYLNLSRINISELPKSLTSLYNLQALWLENCHLLEKLPDGMGNLVNLRLLSLKSCLRLKKLPDGMENLVNLRILEFDKELVCTIKGIGRLSSLQELSCFDVDPTNGSGIEELENLDMLRGKLAIRSLENVVDIEMARKASLQRKEYLQGLTFQWTEDCVVSSETAEELLEALQPNVDRLKYLEIVNYKGRVLPRWLTQCGHLSSLHMIHCPGLQSFPESGLPPSLSDLVICRCPGLQSFPESGLPPSLSTLSIQYCPGLQSFPESGLPPSLSDLVICRCPGLQSFPESGLPPSLKYLYIEDYPGLQSFPESGLPPSLKYLVIQTCPRLQSFPESGLPPSLSDLVIINCKRLQSFPESGLPPSLSDLVICRCPGLQSFPESGLPPSLSNLHIFNCPALEKITSHIPNVFWF